MDHGSFDQLAAGAVLEDLDPDEARLFAAHTSTCDACRALAGDLQATSADLAFAARPRRPPPGLRASVMTAIVGAANDRPVPPVATIVDIESLRHETRRSRRFAWVAAGLAACLAVATVGLGAYAVSLSDRLDRAETAAGAAGRIASDQAAAMTVALDPAHATASLHAESLAPAANAVIVYRPGTRDAFLMASNLPATPADHVYQLWVADATGVHPLGTFPYDGSGPVVVPVGVDLAGSSAAMVTLEPTGGAVGEPGPQVVFGEL
jgi:anti-sigma-K factor RskA